MEIKTAEEALKVLKGVAEAKKNGTSRSDKDLGDEVAKALKVLKEAGLNVDYQRDDGPVFKSSWGTPDRLTAPRMAYAKAIKKRAGSDEWLQKFHRWNDDVLLASAVLQKTPGEVLKNYPELGEIWDHDLGKGSGELAKAMAAGTAGAGSEWIPEIFSPELIDMIRIERVLAQAFPHFTMPNGTVKKSQLIADFTPYGIAESTGNTPYNVPAVVSNLGTDRETLTAVEVIASSIFSKTIEDDSIIPMIPTIRRQLVIALAEGEENCIINGSTEATHPDSDVVAAAGGVSDVQSLWNGLRADAMGADFSTTTGTVDLSGANMTADNVMKLKLLQGRFGAKDSDSIFLTSPQGLVKLMGLRDSSGAQILLTIDKLGPNAVLLKGAAGQLLGCDVVVSDLVKTTLDSSGVVPSTPGSTTQILRVNKPAFMVGDRRMLDVEMDSAPLTRQRIMVGTVRKIFARLKPAKSASDRAVTVGLNVSVA